MEYHLDRQVYHESEFSGSRLELSVIPHFPRTTLFASQTVNVWKYVFSQVQKVEKEQREL